MILSRISPARTKRVVRGYTLIEMIVAVGIFSVIMLTATGAFLNLIRLDREARMTNDVVTNLSFAVDSMARTLRTGLNYDCDPSTAGTFDNCRNTPGTSVQFQDADNRTVRYSLSSGQIVVATCTPAPCTPGGATPLTDPRINIEVLDFYVRGIGVSEGCGNRTEPQVTFNLYGKMTTAQGVSQDFAIQGGATQRVLDLSATVCP